MAPPARSNEEESTGTRTRSLYDPVSQLPFKLSRSKIELFLDCPRCFYLDRRSGIGRPTGPAFTLNVAVDLLLKREFDAYRTEGTAHPSMRKQGIDAVPLRHASLDDWRDNWKGVQVLHAPTQFLVTGALDDIWVNPQGEMIVVDYKATSSSREITLSSRAAYKRQLEVYQWLLRRSGFLVSDTGYFVFVNADRQRASFENRLEFTMSILPYTGSDAWIEDALSEAKICLSRTLLPLPRPSCEWCAYRKAASVLDALAS